MRHRPTAGVLGWWLTLTVAALVLHAAGGALPAPPVTAPSEWSAWMVGRDPVVVAFGLARLLALTAAWYALGVTALGVALRLVRAGRVTAAVDRLTLLPLRRLVAATVTVGISFGPLGSAAVAAGPAPGGPAPGSVPTTTVVASPPDRDTGSSPPMTMHRLDPGEAGPAPPASSPTPGAEAPIPAPTDAEATDHADATDSAGTWTVQPGQCFWSIADSALGRAWGRPPTSAEIVPYWHRLIGANRGELADPHNADLIFPGQEFTLPPP